MKLTKVIAAIFLGSTVVVAGALSGLLSGCAERVGSGQTVSIPLVSISCTTTHCLQNAPARAILVYTTSSCTNAQFGETVAGSTTLTCNAFGCSGTITSFTGTSGRSENTIEEGFYSICVVLDFNSDYSGTATVGDSTGSLANTYITTGTSTLNVTSFTDL